MILTVLTVGTVETLIMAILGIFGTLIVQGIKKFSGNSLEGTKALNITVLVSTVLAILGGFATNAFTDVNGTFTLASIVNGAIVVFGVATLAYKYLLSKEAPAPIA